MKMTGLENLYGPYKRHMQKRIESQKVLNVFRNYHSMDSPCECRATLQGEELEVAPETCDLIVDFNYPLEMRFKAHSLHLPKQTMRVSISCDIYM